MQSTDLATTAKPTASEPELRAAVNAARTLGDRDAARRLCAEARSAFPNAAWPWLVAAEIETQAQRVPEAEALLYEAVSRFPDDFWTRRAHALIAKDQGDSVEAYTRSRALRQDFPDQPAAHSAFVHLLLDMNLYAEAEAEATASIARFPGFAWLLFMYARSADAVADTATSVARWTNLLLCHPEHEAAYLPAVRAYLKADRIEEAAGLAREGVRLLPETRATQAALDAVLAAGAFDPPSPVEPADAVLASALHAEQTGDWSEAAQLWTVLRDQVPSLALGYTRGARALLHLGRAAEAEIVLAKAVRDRPDDPGVLEARADAALQRGAWEEAAARFNALRQVVPAAPQAALGLARALQALRRLDEADAIFAGLLQDQPGNLALAEEFARIAAERGDMAEAARRWTRVTGAFPDHRQGFVQLIAALRQAERVAEADLMLTQAVARFPDDLELALSWARAGQQAGGAKESRARWEVLCRRFPDLAAVAPG